MRALSLCSYPGPPLCTVRLLAPGRCARHKAPRKGGAWSHRRPRTTHEQYASAAWKQARKDTIKREPVCYLCHVRPSTTADHVIPRYKGGTDAPSNLRGCCTPCQRTKAAHEGNEAKRARA